VSPSGLYPGWVNIGWKRWVRIRWKSTTGITGSGKSTLIDLILGLLPPSSGQIWIEGEALDATNLRRWQKRIAHVPQSIFLTDSSIGENVALGVPPQHIDTSRLRRVMAAAQMTEFVDRLPQGLATRVGERGVQLSGGQRQRIGLARALYKQADVLILDEATSALDGATESRVMDAIYHLNPNVIILMIAHRLSTLEKCDAIYEIFAGQLRWGNGRQSERGSIDNSPISSF
ncbi:ATP-binding cassette domain-containing protein, partial [Hydrogenophaga defluvii]